MIKFYGITCRGCEDRYIETAAHLEQHGLDVTWLRGMNGKHAGLNTAHPYTADDPSGKYRIPSGHVSLCVNHWFAWHFAQLDGRDVAVFIEDDCRVVDGFMAYLEARLQELEAIDPEWDFCYLGHLEGSTDSAHKGQCYEWVNGSIAKCKSDPYGTHCYAVRHKALPLLIDKCERIYANIDIAIWNEVIPHLRHYALVPPLAGQKQDTETFRNTLGESA
jgi:GR25 family glycosyltransferase involved in LPS biosynthesis